MKSLWRAPPSRVLCPTPLQRRHLPITGISPRTRFTPQEWSGVRHVTLEAGEGKTGHISAGPNETIMYFDQMFPLKLQWLFKLPFTAEAALPNLIRKLKVDSVAASDLEKIFAQANVDSSNLKVLEKLPRLKEGGAFVKFSHDQSISSKDVESGVKAYLKEKQIKPWWNPFQRIRANLVHGRPWVEDLYRLPSSRLKVEFLPTSPDGATAAELSQEQLYSFFRPYGKLADIQSQEPDSKIVPKFAYLYFATARRAIMAKNCLHGYVVSEAEGGGKSGTLLRLSYEQKNKGHWIRDWLFSHPRIVIPALAAIVAFITVAVFDPIRTFFIEAHITRKYNVTDSKIYRWFRSRATDILSFRRRAKDDDDGMAAVWEDRKGNIEQIQTWLMETAETFVIVQGPRGSGKRELVLDQALKGRHNTLVIDCKPIQEAHGDSATICAAAAEVGYKPVFSWMNSVSGMIDLAAQGATGIKTGFSETLDTQLTKIWNNTATALKRIALHDRKKDDKDAHLTEDEYLEQHPEKRPVIVIDNFLHKSQESSVVYDKIAEWAASLTTANVAHVVFLTNDVSFSKSLSKALPDRVFRQISLSDCSPEVAKRFVITHLDADADDESDDNNMIISTDAEGNTTKTKRPPPSQRRSDLAELDSCIAHLGGRLTDLEFLARRIKTGETPSKAVREIIDQSASEILKMYLLGIDDSEKKWTPEQAWMLIKKIAASDGEQGLRYNEVLLTDTFKSGGDKVLAALEQAELISIASVNGRPHSIKPGKPVYLPAFRTLTEDTVLKAKLDLQILSESIKNETAGVDKCLQELKTISEMSAGGPPRQLVGRVEYLLAKVNGSQLKIMEMEKESGALKAILTSKY
ncbi:hypothetical protein K402DRAFT_460843 [Aulographum hederae CBS 113979]|uniref:Mitochondrial escape protein 2 n=1 Tax=Aulographum hederae CBS 113979 TaxID=1176131 RepID=A0A6G1HA90_9PEZI|nr:hypothetical protein K402DRAFT_460843 [Aulographum hederae CBS 113979]